MGRVVITWKDSGKTSTFNNCGYTVGFKKGTKKRVLKIFKKGAGKGSAPFRQYDLNKIDTWKCHK